MNAAIEKLLADGNHVAIHLNQKTGLPDPYAAPVVFTGTVPDDIAARPYALVIHHGHASSIDVYRAACVKTPLKPSVNILDLGDAHNRNDHTRLPLCFNTPQQAQAYWDALTPAERRQRRLTNA